MNFKNKLFWIVAIAFVARLIVGVSLHLGLPLYGHADEDDRAGYETPVTKNGSESATSEPFSYSGAYVV